MKKSFFLLLAVACFLPPFSLNGQEKPPATAKVPPGTGPDRPLQRVSQLDRLSEFSRNEQLQELVQVYQGKPPGEVKPDKRAGQLTQVKFTRPIGMKVQWLTGPHTFSAVPLETPGRHDFAQGSVVRLKLSNIESHPDLVVYPTLQVMPPNARAATFLAHNAVTVGFTEEDFKNVAEGSFVTKVIYLPNPEFQDMAGTGTDELLSTRLEPGQDPIRQASRRGTVLLVIRMGNKLE